MKIKEVIEKTKLTDKAIRLYIDNGLIAPSIDESYSGRKSIDFSSEDVERLNNIALLRKAGFSITDIKGISESEDKAKSVLLNFIEETEKNINIKTEILRKLKNINIDDNITMDIICSSLSAAVSESEVPHEDMNLSFKERARKNFAIVIAVMGMAFTVLNVIFVLIVFNSEYVHLAFEKETLSIYLFCYGGNIVIFVLSLILLVINYNHVSVGKKSKVDLISSAISLLMVLIGVLTFFTSFLGTMFLSVGFSSRTQNLNDYLIFDEYVEDVMGDEIRDLFPKKIPDSASKIEERTYENTYPFTSKYYYKYSNSIDARFDIVAEWILSENEYNNAKNSVIGKELYSVNKGDWHCLVVMDENYNNNDEERDLWATDCWENDYYWYLIFAYNDKSNKVRYIASHAIDAYSYGPYYLTLDW